MKITVFGGGGFIGSTIVDRLLLDGHSIRVFERPRVGEYRKFLPHENVEWMTGDLLATSDINKAVEGVDAVLHLVSTTLPKSSNEDPIYDVQSNLIASLQLLNAMVAHKVGRIVFISSGGTVYGSPKYIPIDEKHPTDPEVSYGITKLAIEKYILMYGHIHGIKPVILRVANPYGERQRVETAQGAVGVFIHNVLKQVPIEIWGDGSVQRDFLHVSDVAEAFAKSISYSGNAGVFNISSGVGTSLNSLLELIGEVSGAEVSRVYKPGRSFDVPVSVLSNDLAREELGWSPQVSMKEGIARTFEWAKKESEK
ncbi:NAD-dependent epimerase/dehydratase family protein [Pseudomonas sp. 10S4]|uniref:NAD-dependent epimerase/dehydratase family protein n=1 Tax=Pseudomonas sp. 10S4 TaxID=3048583 RepID=UPI002B239365|nr:MULTISPECIES: NAD-dependent epimerase/dehydratase family protein [unclassified Pseudomonas]MEB0224699.1 NAD-dependent epimerase/dehydratase family protein [Pseudomonas sp. 5S1]MEB0295847.1 NAD-dependent epimerase/dehydratase family protein [Pseudomonas sp. 10S4]